MNLTNRNGLLPIMDAICGKPCVFFVILNVMIVVQ